MRDLNNNGADALNRGSIDEGAAMLQEAITRTEGSSEVEARNLRARALLNLSGVYDYRAELGEALRLVDESLAIGATLVEEIGDERGNRTVLVNGMVSRAQILAQSDRQDEALAQTDEAMILLDARRHRPSGPHALPSAHYPRVAAAVHRALSGCRGRGSTRPRSCDASGSDARPHPYLALASIAQQTDNLTAAHEFIELANALQTPDSDLVTRQIALENRARAAMQQERYDEAGELFRQAAVLAHEGSLVTRETASRMGAAAAYLQTGNPVLAVKVLRQLIAELGTEGAVHD